MSADEIRRLVRIYSAKEKNLKCELEKFNDAEMTPNIENISIARNDAIMTIQALLDYAAMVERCEKLKLNMIPHRHDIELVDYIIRGDAGNVGQ